MPKIPATRLGRHAAAIAFDGMPLGEASFLVRLKPRVVDHSMQSGFTLLNRAIAAEMQQLPLSVRPTTSNIHVRWPVPVNHPLVSDPSTVINCASAQN